MNYNGIIFNKEFYKGKTFEVFKKNEANHELSDEQMQEAFALLQKEEKAEKTAQPAEFTEKVKK